GTSASYTNLADGSHTFQVKAQDLGGNQDASPASVTWTVHAQAPVVTFTGGPGQNGYSGAAVTFTWSSTLSPVATSVTYAYSLDGGAFSAESATPTASFTGLSEGAHTLVARATDDANLQGSATRNWTVDVTSPNTVIASGPGDGTWVNTSSVTYTLSGTDNLTPVASLRYRVGLDNSPTNILSDNTA